MKARASNLLPPPDLLTTHVLHRRRPRGGGGGGSGGGSGPRLREGLKRRLRESPAIIRNQRLPAAGHVAAAAECAGAALMAVSPPPSQVDSNFTHGKLERKSATGNGETRKEEENNESPKTR